MGHFLFVVCLAHAGHFFGDREPALFFLASALLLLFAGAGRYSANAAAGGRARRDAVLDWSATEMAR